MASTFMSTAQQTKQIIAGVFGGIGAQMAFSSLLSWVAPSITGFYTLPFIAMFQFLGIPAKSTEILYNIMNRWWDPDKDELMRTTANALASTQLDPNVKQELVRQLAHYKDLRNRIDNVLKDVNKKQIEPSQGALTLLQLSQYLSKIRANIAKLDGNDKEQLKELDNFQQLLEEQANVLAQMRAVKARTRAISIQKGNGVLAAEATRSLFSIDKLQSATEKNIDSVRKQSARVEQERRQDQREELEEERTSHSATLEAIRSRGPKPQLGPSIGARDSTQPTASSAMPSSSSTLLPPIPLSTSYVRASPQKPQPPAAAPPRFSPPKLSARDVASSTRTPAKNAPLLHTAAVEGSARKPPAVRKTAQKNSFALRSEAKESPSKSLKHQRHSQRRRQHGVTPWVSDSSLSSTITPKNVVLMGTLKT